MRVKVILKTTQTGTFETGDLPVNLVRDLFQNNDGTFDENWGLADVCSDDAWTTDSIEVEEVPSLNRKSK